ncbi:MAG: formate--tetrahydrofolate ligase [Candidatus Brocadiales bacterium]
MLSDIEIARRAKMKPIVEIAGELGINRDEIELHGDYKAKVKLDILDRIKDRPNGKYIDVTAVTPTPLGEGKTVNTIGLALGLNKIGKNTIACIRQPSLGPVFGIKGGAAGGGYSQVVPMEDFNLNLTGDMHAVSIAHNLLAAFVDTSVLLKNPLNIDPLTICWKRVVDVNDRALRNIIVGLGGKENGIPRETGFDLSSASEVLAILALTTGLQDMRKKIGKLIVAYTRDGKPVTAEDVKCAGSMTVLLRDAIKPNLMQTVENTPVFVHTGPFGNIAHGNSSILADQMAIRLGEYVVTESGFGADLGMEKFFNIKCRYSGLIPNAVAIVATIRALKMHSGKFKIVPGKPLDKGLVEENIEAVVTGCSNLKKHIENVKAYGIPSVVAINRFTKDTDHEIETVRKEALAAGAEDVVVSDVWEKGGEGGREFAKAVVAAAEKKSNFKFLYELDWSIEKKIEAIATKTYGAKEVEFQPLAKKKIHSFNKLGLNNLPICMAKTHLSLSHDPKMLGAPTGYVFPVRDIKASAGAGFLYALCGDIKTMPGLGSKPAGQEIDIDEKGNIIGLS